MLDLRQSQSNRGQRPRTVQVCQLGGPAGREGNRAIDGASPGHRRLRVPGARRPHGVQDIGRRIVRVERAHPVGVGERPVGHVVVERRCVGGDQHRETERHRHPDVHPARALTRIAHQRIDEWCAELPVHHILQRCVHHGHTVQDDRNISDAAHIAPVPGEPDAIDLPGAGVRGDHALAEEHAAAVSRAIPIVAVLPARIGTGELRRGDTGSQFRQPIQPAVGTPARGLRTGDRRIGRRRKRSHPRTRPRHDQRQRDPERYRIPTNPHPHPALVSDCCRLMHPADYRQIRREVRRAVLPHSDTPKPNSGAPRHRCRTDRSSSGRADRRVHGRGSRWIRRCAR